MELNFKKYGAGPPLIILHGLFGSLDNWQTLAKKFAENFSVYVPDLRNHGRSPQSDEPFTYSALAGDLELFLDSNSIEDAFLIGHSMGGKVAMKFTLMHPLRTKRIIVADMAPVRYGPHHGEVFRAMDKLDLANLINRTDADQELIHELPDFAVRQFLLKNLERKKDGGYQWKFNLNVIRRDYDDILAGIDGTPYNGPALFLRGGNSNYVKDDMLKSIYQLFPKAQLITIEGAGHWVHADKPDAFYKAVVDFLL